MNKQFLTIFIFLLGVKCNFICAQPAKDSMHNPLLSYSPIWAGKKYTDCHTAFQTQYLTEEEKNVIWVLNMIRLNPKLFLKTVLLNPKCRYYVKPEKRDFYFISLITKFNTMKPINSLLVPDSMAFVSARCHAIASGKNGIIGHDRVNNNCEKDFHGECCDYGNNNALDILLNLLIDSGIPELGHRVICLSDSYQKLGVSIQPHAVYRVNTVLDFKWP
jgi:hypothetical protein